MKDSVLVTVKVKEGSIYINDTHCTFLAKNASAEKLSSVTYIEHDYPVYDLTGEFSELFELKNDEQLIGLKISLNDLKTLMFKSTDSLLEVLAIEHHPNIEQIFYDVYYEPRKFPNTYSPFLKSKPQVFSLRGT